MKTKKTKITKPKFANYFLRSFIPLFLAGTLAFAALYAVVDKYLESLILDERRDYFNRLTDCCQELYECGYGFDERENKIYINNASGVIIDQLCKVDINTPTGSSSDTITGTITFVNQNNRIVDARGKFLYMTLLYAQSGGYSEYWIGDVPVKQCKDTLFCILRGNEDSDIRDGMYYCYDEEIVAKINESVQPEIDYLYENFDNLHYKTLLAESLGIDYFVDTPSYTLEEFYINEEDGDLVPVKVRVTLIDEELALGSDDSDKKKETLVELQPDVDLTGYKHITSDMCRSKITMCFTCPDSYLDKSAANSFVHEEDIYKSDDEFTDFWSGWELRYSERDISSLLNACPGIVSMAYIVVVFIVLLLTFIITAFKYNHAKSVYEIFEYRKKVTDAMAHDLKTPLAAISAYAENLEENVNSDKRGYYTSRIRENVDSMNRMIEGVLDFSKNESGEVKVEIKELSVKDCVKSEVDAMKDLFEKNDLKVEITGSDVLVKTDENLFRQALKNLLSNANNFAREGTVVDVTVTASELIISNKTDEKVKNVDDLKKPFVKGSGERGDKSGTGLGLAIAESSLEAAGQKLEIAMEGDLFKAKVIF